MSDEQTRKHPDLFTPEEAATYLHLDSERGLETLREKFGLIAHAGINRSFIYWREDLDRVALRIVGRDRTHERVDKNRPLRIAGARA